MNLHLIEFQVQLRCCFKSFNESTFDHWDPGCLFMFRLTWLGSTFFAFPLILRSFSCKKWGILMNYDKIMRNYDELWWIMMNYAKNDSQSDEVEGLLRLSLSWVEGQRKHFKRQRHDFIPNFKLLISKWNQGKNIHHRLSWFIMWFIMWSIMWSIIAMMGIMWYHSSTETERRLTDHR